MARLGAVIAEAIVHHYGRDEFLRRLAHPFWFQSFGAVMGMDWHSSGITTSVLGALKRGLGPISSELGLYVCGGKGSHSRQTPHELMAIGERTGFDGAALAKASRLVAKVDSAAVQDGFDLYLHGFIVTADGQWAVVQQGMNDSTGMARRYHWLSEGLGKLCRRSAFRHRRREPGRDHQSDRPPRRGLPAEATRPAYKTLARIASLVRFRLWKAVGPPTDQPFLPHLVMPSHHDVRPKDVILRRLHGALAAAANCGPADFADLLLVPGVGARTVQSLAMVAEVIHGAPCRFADPARFSFAHGGKDRHPYPVPTKVYDKTISVLKSAIGAARLGNEERLGAIQRLDREARRLERFVSGPALQETVAKEQRLSHDYGGRSVFGWEPEPCDSVASAKWSGQNRNRLRRNPEQSLSSRNEACAVSGIANKLFDF